MAYQQYLCQVGGVIVNTNIIKIKYSVDLPERQLGVSVIMQTRFSAPGSPFVLTNVTHFSRCLVHAASILYFAEPLGIVPVERIGTAHAP